MNIQETWDSKGRLIVSKQYVPEIKERKAYQVGNRIYRTKRAAAKTQAWSAILNKYAGIEFRENTVKEKNLEDIKSLRGIDCDCAEEDYFDGEFHYYHADECPLHDRQTGYFARLHRKMMDAILFEWERMQS